MSISFDESLEWGQAGESAIAKWLRRRGCYVLPVYEKILDTGKGPHLFTPTGSLVAPDFFVFRDINAFWIEAKRKSAFSWYRKSGIWTTGIDLHHYEQYLLVDDFTPWPVWLLFLHEGGQAKDSPPNSPAGLFGRTLEKLRKCENHRSDRWGPNGMVYWNHKDLLKIANLEEVVL